MSSVRQPCAVREMSDVECAYLGALIDSEGGIYPHATWPRSWHLRITNSEIELISAALRITGVGSVYYQAPNRKLGDQRPRGKKPLWVWAVHAFNDVNSIVRQLQGVSLKAQLVLPAIEGVY